MRIATPTIPTLPCARGLAFALALLVAGCGSGGAGRAARVTPPSEAARPAAQELSVTLASGALTRSYLARIPAKTDAAAPLPLVIALHGGGGTGAWMRRVAGLDALADAHGFVVAYPDGHANRWADGRGTTTPDRAGVDDVAFIAALIDDLAARTPIDRRRVYAVGISNGGMMSLQLACALPSRIAAVAAIAATMPAQLATPGACPPGRAVPVLFMHGDLDRLMPRAGGALPRGPGGDVLSTADSVAFWNGRNACAPAPIAITTTDRMNDGTSIRLFRYGGCAGGGENRFYDVIGGGHTWPGASQNLPAAIVGRTSTEIDASREIWAFFSAVRLP